MAEKVRFQLVFDNQNRNVPTSENQVRFQLVGDNTSEFNMRQLNAMPNTDPVKSYEQMRDSTFKKLVTGNPIPSRYPTAGIGAKPKDSLSLNDKLNISVAKDKYASGQKLTIAEQVSLMKQSKDISDNTGTPQQSISSLLKKQTGNDYRDRISPEMQEESKTKEITAKLSGLKNTSSGKSAERIISDANEKLFSPALASHNKFISDSIEKSKESDISYLSPIEQKQYRNNNAVSSFYGDQYLKSKQDKIANLKGKAIADEYINGTIGDKILIGLDTYFRTGANRAFSGQVAGLSALSGLVSGKESSYSSNTIASEYANQYLDQYFSENNKHIESVVQDLAVNFSNNISAQAIGTITGMPMFGLATFALSVFGNAYEETKKQGYSTKESTLYALSNTASEASLQYLIGGIPGMGGVLSGKTIEALSKNVSKSIVKSAIKVFGRMTGEFIEESTQDLIDPIVRNLILHEENKTVFNDTMNQLKSASYSGFIGAFSALLLGGVSAHSEAVTERDYQMYGAMFKRLTESGDVTVKDLAQYGMMIDSDGEVNNLSKQLYDGKAKENDYNVGKLYVAVVTNMQDSVSFANSAYGSKIKSEEDGVSKVIKSYDDMIEDGAYYPYSVRTQAETIKNKLDSAEEITDEEIGRFSRDVSMYSPRAKIDGEILKNSDSSSSPELQSNANDTAQPQSKSAFTELSAQKPPYDLIEDGMAKVSGTVRLTDEQKEIKSIGEQLGWKIGFDDIYVRDDNGKMVMGENHRVVHADGEVDRANKKITFDYNNQRPLQFIMKHEIADYITINQSAYNDFANAVMDSSVFKDWVKSKGFDSVLAYNGQIAANRIKSGDPNFTRKGANPEYEANIEMVSDFSAEKLFGDEKSLNGFLESLKPQQRKTFIQRVLDLIRSIKDRLTGKSKTFEGEISALEKKFVKAYQAAEQEIKQKTSADSDGVRYSFDGYAEDGKGKYTSNFPKGTPKSAKSEKILSYIQEVWSKNPISLVIKDGETERTIDAKFDPEYDKSGNTNTDASKLMGGNRHGTSSEQRVTLDLADDYYQIASESKYNYSKDETGKDNPAHKDVTQWHYFVNDIYFAEYGSKEYQPYRVSINVKEKADGDFVYSFSAEKQREPSTHRTLHADVNGEYNSTANAELSTDSINQNDPSVNINSMPENKRYSVPTINNDDLLKQYEDGKISRDEFLNMVSGKRTTKEETPMQIANMKPEDADTTPKVKRRIITADGDSDSKTYKSLQKSKIFGKEFKEEFKKDDYIRRYQSVTNKDTLLEAAKELDSGGENYVLEWMAKDAKHASVIDTAVGFILLDRYQRVGDSESAMNVADKIREIGTLSGQTVQLFSILGRLDPSTMAVYAQKELSKAFKEMAKEKTQHWIDKNSERFNLTEDDIEFIRRRTLQAAMLPEGRDKDIRIAEIATRIQDKLPPKKGQSIKALQRISMLLNPKTNIRNIVGNATMVPVFMATDYFGAAIDKVVSLKTGVRTTGTSGMLGNQLTKDGRKHNGEIVKGFMKGGFESIDDFRRHINTRSEEMNRFEIGKGNITNSNGKSFNEQHSLKFFSDCAKALNAMDRLTSFCLELGDRPFYEMWFVNSLNNQIKLNNVTEATPEMIEIATQEALERTWQDSNHMTKSVSMIRTGLNYFSYPIYKKLGYGLGDVYVKFTKTPANLAKALVDFSPVGFVKAISLDAMELTKSIQKGNYDAKLQRQFVNDLSKGIVGSIVMIIAYTLTNMGALTGKGDDDDDLAYFEKNLAGRAPYSVVIGGNSYSYEWMQPMSGLVAAVTDYMKTKEENPDNDELQNIKEAFKAGGTVLFNQSFMQSLQQLFKNDDIVGNAIDGILNEPAVFVPQALSQFSNVTDEYRRNTYEYGNKFETALNKVKVKIPGFRQTLEKQVDVLGNDVKNQQHSIFNAFFNPANVYSKTKDDIADKVYALYEQTGEASVIPRKSPNYITVKKIKVNYSAEESAKYQKIMGQTACEILDEAFDEKEYENLSDSQKVKFITSVYDYAAANAKSQFVYQYDVLNATTGGVLSQEQYDDLNDKAKKYLAEKYFMDDYIDKNYKSKIKGSAADYFLKKAKG